MSISANKEKGLIFWSELPFYKIFVSVIMFSAVVLFVDQKDYLFQLFFEYRIREIIIGACFGIALVMLCFARRYLYDLLKMPCGNSADAVVVFCALSCILLLICEVILEWCSLYKIILLVLGMIISISVIVARYIFCKIISNRKKQVSNNIVDIGQLLANRVTEYKLPIVFSEEVSEYDLLGREGLVNVIYSSIKACNPNHVYVIGLIGAWGSGKTTMLNILKKRIRESSNDFIWIDDFDPWMFGSQEALLYGMYDMILSKTGIRYSTYSSEQTYRRLKEVVTKHSELSGISSAFLDVNRRDYETVEQMKRKIGLYLNRLKYPVVFVIDNLDRVDADNILFLFKLIGSVFDLPNIIYVLAYDKERIEEVFSDISKVNPKYIEKIVQQEIVIPEIQRDTLMTICSSCIERTLLLYGICQEDIVRFNDISQVICNNVSDLRQFKRLLNSAFASTFLYDNELYKPHLLAIEVIRFLEPELYDEIKRNKKFFVSRDMHYSGDELYIGSANKKSFNESASNFFNELFSAYKAYEVMLANLFPYVKRHKNGLVLLSDNMYYDDAPEHNAIASIASVKYFDLYFSYGSNYFLAINSSVEKFIEIVNSSEIDTIRTITENKIEKIEKNAQHEWFERLQNNLEKINVYARREVAFGICNSVKNIDTTKGFFMLSADQRALIVVTKLLKDADNYVIESLVEVFSKNYNIQLLEEIRIDCEVFEKREKLGFGNLKKTVEVKYNELCSEILKGGIDIYQDSIYRRLKVWSLYRSVPEGEKKIIHNYMNNIINKQNVYRILSDMIVEFTGTRGYGYFFNEDYIEMLLGNKKTLRSFVENLIPGNDTEKFILSIWRKMENGIKNEFGEIAFYSAVPINLIL